MQEEKCQVCCWNHVMKAHNYYEHKCSVWMHLWPVWDCGTHRDHKNTHRTSVRIPKERNQVRVRLRAALWLHANQAMPLSVPLNLDNVNNYQVSRTTQGLYMKLALETRAVNRRSAICSTSVGNCCGHQHGWLEVKRARTGPRTLQ
jgi:hypothetical protein